VYVLEIPERVSLAIGRRGPAPILAALGSATEIQASLVPTGGGRHWLQLNARTRGELDIEPGDPVRVVLVVPKARRAMKTRRLLIRKYARHCENAGSAFWSHVKATWRSALSPGDMGRIENV
jgi:hypothetical protein